MVATAAAGVLALATVFTIAPSDPCLDSADANRSVDRQTLAVVGTDAVPKVVRDPVIITPGRSVYVSGGTNYDWAKLVLSYGGWPVANDSVTVIVRWMRQENYIDSWWNNNNPLNNGWGSGGGAGLGSYPSLDIAARNAAEALNTHPGYGAIKAAFAAAEPAATIEHAIWASPWASSHYANGTRWHYTSVPTVKAPPAAW